MQQPPADVVDTSHGGGIDAARARFGGRAQDWIDMSTGINPVPYPLPNLPNEAWSRLPDHEAYDQLMTTARRFWRVPDEAAIVAAPGTSALIARLPALVPPARVRIPAPTYNEHRRAFLAQGWSASDGEAEALVLVHPNNPDGRLWTAGDAKADLVVIDESFADTVPDRSLIALATTPGVLMLKGLGKFWGLAGLRLGFAIGDPALVGQLEKLLGPWPVSGPALVIGAAALSDMDWAEVTRTRLFTDAARLDGLLTKAGARIIGGTSLFRLAEVTDAARWQEALARCHIWTRIFPYSDRWLRLGIPASESEWSRLTEALEDLR
ncbi:MAG: threonine-phosphate decarboxylase [Cereibacter sphaeroides]|uniref:threonine-phosphate decarboxylase n=1 Tax=Cereibacter sphaeroides TaxID=1063 RepID=A0A2W5SAS6_CERSP|nr:MAG: threonine-phosphate decarboxylase [Cereibacter sphaeroides]